MPSDSTQTSLPSDVQEMALELDKYRQIVETAGDAVVTINRHHEVVYMNRAAEDMFGYRREEILGGDLSPLIPPEHRKEHQGYVDRFLRTRKPKLLGHAAELEAERRDGSRFAVSISFNLAGSVEEPLFTAIMRDLSAEKDLAERVRDAEALAAVGRMVATVGHEIRTALTLIGGFASQLDREPHLSDKGRRKLQIIHQEVARLDVMLGELKDLSRPHRFEWRAVDMADLVRQVADLMKPKLKENNIQLRTDIASRLPRITADKNRMSQVLINLINNAAQASPPGSEVMVKLAKGGDKGGVFLEVKDMGEGIPPESLKQIFTPFYTTKEQGTGLGLPLARRIVEEHGGMVFIDSTPETGTTALIVLPPENKGAAPAMNPANHTGS